MENNYLILDMGTGNSRVGLVSSDGVVLGIRSYVIHYTKTRSISFRKSGAVIS